MAGRPVAFKARPERIILLDARDAVSMALLDPQPMARVVGWAGLDGLDSDAVLAALKAAAGRDVPVIGSMAPGSISAEAIIALKPDLIVTTRQVEGANGDVSSQFTAFGIPVLFSDTSSNAGRSGGDDLPALLRMWGRLLGQEARAEALLAFIEARFAQIAACLDHQPPRKVYLELQSTYEDCCWAAGRAVWGALLTRAGGRSLDAVTAPWFQKLHVEQLVVEQPDLYIAAGGAFARGTRPAIAPGLPAAEAPRRPAHAGRAAGHGPADGGEGAQDRRRLDRARRHSPAQPAVRRARRHLAASAGLPCPRSDADAARLE